MTATPTADILGLGAVALDDLLFVSAYPPADGKTAIVRRERRYGGLTGTALVAASRLGALCRYDGTLGTDDDSEGVIDWLRAEGIDVSGVRRRDGAGPLRSTIVVGQEDATRTVFSDRSAFVGPSIDAPPEEVLLSCRLLFLDHFGPAGTLRAARIARGAGRPIVADFERETGPEFPELLATVDHLIVGRRFAERLTGAADPAMAARRLWSDRRAVVAVTSGAEGSDWIESADPDRVVHQPAFAVRAEQTVGCGDVFHGAYAAMLARGEASVAERIRVAAAAGALRAARPGAGPPSLEAVRTFLWDRG